MDHSYAGAGSFTWTLTVTDGLGGSCQGSGTIVVTTCTPAAITAQPLSTTVPTGTTSTLSVTATGSPALSYQWYQGMSGNTSTPVGTNSASFTTPVLTQTTSYWVRLSNGCGTPADSATATVTVTVCTLSCTATVQEKGTVNLAVNFAGSATASGCAGTVTYDWDFGDGSSHSTQQNPGHLYASVGSKAWTLTVQAGSTTCTRTGHITIVNPPMITLIKKASPPFKLVVTGSNLQSGIRVFIDGMEWTSVTWKKDAKILLTGAGLKTAVPKGTTHAFRFLNPDGGEALTTWGW